LETTDLYQILGVEPDASQDDIKRAFRTLARRYHPDATGGDAESSERYKALSGAYAVLSDPEKRREYDMRRAGGLGTGLFGTTLEEIFESFFSGGRRPRERTRARQGESIEVELPLDFRDALFGTTRNLEFQRYEPCARCGGDGCEPGSSPIRCNRCDGTGEIQEVRRSVFGNLVTSYPCAACGQTGQVVLTPCKDCRGVGRVLSDADLKVEVPPGVETGDRLRVPGHGEAGRAGGVPGDLYVRFLVEADERFERVGDELVCWVEVPMTTAALGGEVQFESMDGPERLQIPRGVQSAAMFRLRGRGAPRRGSRGRGDLVVRVHVLTPTDLDAEQERVMKHLAELRGEETKEAGVLARLRRALGYGDSQ
jgi:molecular chaperone DnaJ